MMPWYGWTAIAGAFAVMLWNGLRKQWHALPQAVALFMAGLGDCCLGQRNAMLTGIVCFSVAHILYGMHAYYCGRIIWKNAMTLGVLCMIFLLAFPFGKAIMTVVLPLKMGGALYLIITCLDIGIVCNRRPFGIDGVLCCLGVVLLAVSDVFLVCEQFLALRWSSGFCIPFYFSSILFATAGGLLFKQYPKS